MKLFTRIHSWLVFLALALASHSLSAQGTGEITGRVLSDDGGPLIGATVIVQNTTRGALSGEDGSFRIAGVPAGEVKIAATYVGYQKYEQSLQVPDGGSVEVVIRMVEEAMTLEDVVVVGYGTQRKRDLVGSISKVKSDELNDIVGQSVETQLQGKVTGLNIVQGSGAAGSATVVRVRGIGSLSSGGEPLYVVDGMVITADPLANSSVGGANRNPLTSINPQDIESVEVLKDASATAIYGSRGANGVIIITTKRGDAGKLQVDFSGKWGISRPTNLVDMMDSEEWLQVQQEAWENDGGTGRFPLPQNLTFDQIEGNNTNWYDETVRTGFKQDYYVSLSKGGEKVGVFGGVGYTDSESFLIGNALQRFSGRLNLDIKAIKNLNIKLSASASRSLIDQVDQSFSGGLGFAMSTALPIFPVAYQAADGSDSVRVIDPATGETSPVYFNKFGNPVAQRDLRTWKTQEFRAIGNLNLVFTPVKGLELVGSFNYEYLLLDDFFLEDSLWTEGQTISKGFNNTYTNLSAYATAAYDFDFGNEDHNLRVMAGGEYQDQDKEVFSEEYGNVFDLLYRNPSFENADTLVAPTVDENNSDNWQFASVFARINYNYKNKYYAQVTYRRDGSTKFGANNRFGDFPSVGVGWVISSESFWNSNWFNFFKLKASWGLSGNSDIDWRSQYASFFPFNLNPPVDNAPGYNGQPRIYQVKEGNPDLQWEIKNTYDVGIEMGFFQDRITTSLGYFYSKTRDAIIAQPLQASAGYPDQSFSLNTGIIENYGVEFDITTRNLVGKVKWTTNFNLTHLNNNVLDVGIATPDALGGGFGDTRAVPGNPVNTNFLIRFEDVDPQTGRPIYLTRNGEPTSRYDVVNNRVPAGAGIPNLVGGIDNSFQFGPVDFSFLFIYSLGGDIYDDAAKRQLGVVTTDWNMRSELIGRYWQQPGDDAQYPRLTNTMINWGGNDNPFQNNHTLWLYDATFVRLRNVTLAYNVPLKQNKVFRTMRFSLIGTNLLTFTRYPGSDPEVARQRVSAQERNVGGSSITYLDTPQELAVTFGINLGF